MYCKRDSIDLNRYENNKVRVVHFLSSISVTSGVASVIMNYYRNIDRDKVQFDFIYFNDSDIKYEKEILRLGGTIHKIQRPGLSKKFFKEINDIFNTYSNENIIFHNHELYLNIFIEPIARKNGIKSVIVHSHTTSYSDKLFSSIRNRILCAPLKKQADYYMACSKVAGKAVYGAKNNNFMVLNNAINCEKFKYNELIRKKIRNELNFENKIIVGNVGRFNNQKNHSFLIDIFAKLKERNNNMFLVLVGSGPLLSNIEKKVEQLNLKESVIFLGQRNDIEDLLQAMDIFILPSLYEGLPVIGVEAQISGLPCIMSDAITNEVNINNVKYISLNKSYAIWADEIIEYYDAFERENILEVARLKGFDIKIEAKKLEKFYLNLIHT